MSSKENENIPPSYKPAKKRQHGDIKREVVVGNKDNSSADTSSKPDSIPASYTPLSSRKNPVAYTTTAQGVQPVAKSETTPPTYKPVRTSAQQNFASSSSEAPQPIQHSYEPISYAPSGRSAAQPHRPVAEKATSYTSAKPKRKYKKIVFSTLVVLLVALVAWPSYLYYRANSQIQHVQVQSGEGVSSGTTWLLTGSDSRETSQIKDGTEGERTDSIILVHKADNGQSSMVSIPRDTFVNIEGYGADKINSAFTYGGPQLLVSTVEKLTNTHIDHYVQIGMSGVENLVDAVGGINLCLDYDVDDPKSELVWKAGCHDVNGHDALAFARMRYSDPLGDFGRTQRQRQVISQLTKKVMTASVALNPFTQVALVDAGSQSVVTDQNTNAFNIAQLLLSFKSAQSSNLTGVPPIKDPNYILLSGASTVLLDTEAKNAFFEKMRAGNLTPEDFHKFQ